MSVYENLYVRCKGFTKEEVVEQLKSIGCISNPHQEGTLLSPLYQNMLRNWVRVGFCVDCSEENNINFSSFNYSPIPQVCFLWIRIYPGPRTKICWTIEQTKLYKGMIENYFRRR